MSRTDNFASGQPRKSWTLVGIYNSFDPDVWSQENWHEKKKSIYGPFTSHLRVCWESWLSCRFAALFFLIIHCQVFHTCIRSPVFTDKYHHKLDYFRRYLFWSAYLAVFCLLSSVLCPREAWKAPPSCRAISLHVLHNFRNVLSAVPYTLRFLGKPTDSRAPSIN